MVDTNFTLVSGSYTDEQDLLSELDFFMDQTIQGWTQEAIVTDTVTDKNIAYYTDGSDPGFYDRLWVRIRATSDELRFNGLSNYDGADSDQFGGGGGNTHLPLSTTSGIYWFAGNADAMHVIIRRSSDNVNLHGGFGHFLTYYDSLEDPKPLYVFGQTADLQTFESAIRMRAFGPRSWGKSYSVTASGTSRGYNALHPTLISRGTPNPRSGQPKLMEPVFYTDETFGYNEIRGEVPGLYMSGGTGYDHSDLITITGSLTVASGTYFIHKHSDDVTWMIGPVTVSGEG